MPSKRKKEKLRRRAVREERAQHKSTVAALLGPTQKFDWTRSEVKDALKTAISESLHDVMSRDSFFPRMFFRTELPVELPVLGDDECGPQGVPQPPAKLAP